MNERRAHRVTSFFFSSRRRHTRCGRDWSSDVCSSDLLPSDLKRFPELLKQVRDAGITCDVLFLRSEERRVGKECRFGWSPAHYKRHINDLGACIVFPKVCELQALADGSRGGLGVVRE